jgi:hypothetical protein
LFRGFDQGTIHGNAQNFLTTLSPHVGLLATDAPASTSASVSVGSETLNASDQENPAIPASTSGEVEEEEDVEENVVEEEDDNILGNFIYAHTGPAIENFDKVLPVLGTTSVASRIKNPLNKEEKNLFDADLSVVWDSSFDAALAEADATGTRDAHETAKLNNEQLFRTKNKEGSEKLV